MRILPDEISENRIFQSHLPEARAFTRENRVYNLKQTDTELKGFVLGGEPMPHEVLLRYRPEPEGKGQYLWRCECGSEDPCVHLASLILRSADLGLDKEHWLSLLENRISSAVPAAFPVDDGEGLSLFSGDLFSGGSQDRKQNTVSAAVREAPADHSDIPLFMNLGEGRFPSSAGSAPLRSGLYPD